MNISLSPHLKAFIAGAVASGRFKSSSEVVCEALRLMEERDACLDELRSEIKAGQSSGAPVPFDPQAIKLRGRAALAAKTA
jgi:antitoxin ParD1/3/4